MGKPSNTIESIWKQIKKDSPDKCWIWSGGTDAEGYGKVRFHGKRYQSHRLVFELETGTVPLGQKVLHRCDNPPCCNPSHLFVGTQLDNIKDRHNKGRSRGASHKGESHGMARLTATDVIAIRNLYNNGMKQKVIASRFNIGQTQISRIIRRVRWQHIE